MSCSHQFDDTRLSSGLKKMLRQNGAARTEINSLTKFNFKSFIELIGRLGGETGGTKSKRESI